MTIKTHFIYKGNTEILITIGRDENKNIRIKIYDAHTLWEYKNIFNCCLLYNFIFYFLFVCVCVCREIINETVFFILSLCFFFYFFRLAIIFYAGNLFCLEIIVRSENFLLIITYTRRIVRNKTFNNFFFPEKRRKSWFSFNNYYFNCNEINMRRAFVIF